MKTREWTWIDKIKWPEGPWQNEPDKIQWTDITTNLPCLIVRHEKFGHLCGYVGVTKAHPLFCKDYDELALEVHGGLTFSDTCEDDDKEHGICHLPEPGEPDSIWWFGFDCNHGGDMAPGYETRHRDLFRDQPDLQRFMSRGVYRTLEYVKEECKSLAAQLERIIDAQHAQ
jgi:hypothetical protein